MDIDDDQGHGARLLASADQVDHALLWNACLDPALIAELPSYDHQAAESTVDGPTYQQYPGLDGPSFDDLPLQFQAYPGHDDDQRH